MILFLCKAKNRLLCCTHSQRALEAVKLVCFDSTALYWPWKILQLALCRFLAGKESPSGHCPFISSSSSSSQYWTTSGMMKEPQECTSFQHYSARDVVLRTCGGNKDAIPLILQRQLCWHLCVMNHTQGLEDVLAQYCAGVSRLVKLKQFYLQPRPTRAHLIIYVVA